MSPTFLYGFIAFLSLLCVFDGKVTNVLQQERVIREISNQKKAEPPQVSKVQQQTSITRKCSINSCQCRVSHHKKLIPDFKKTIVWSKLTLKCNFFEGLKSFSRLTKSMVYDGSSEVNEDVQTWNGLFPYEIQEIVDDMTNDIIDGNDSITREKKAFDIIEVKVSDKSKDLKVISNCNGGERNTVCFDDFLDKDLNYVTRLELDRVRFKHFGTVDSPVLQIFPNLHRLKIRAEESMVGGKGNFEVQLVDFFYLRELVVEADKVTIKLLCSFQSSCDLDNPKGFHLLRLGVYNARLTGNIEVSEKIKLPMKINKLELHQNVRINKHIVVFNKVDFQNVFMVLNSPSDALNIPDFSKSRINEEFCIHGGVQNVIDILPKIYEMGLQYPLKLEIGMLETYSVPFIRVDHTNFDESNFDANCLYGKKLLLHAKENEYTIKLNITESKKLLIFRGLHLKLSDIARRAKSWTTYERVQEIRVYAYNINVDIEPSATKLLNKKLIINYVYIGTTKESIVGIKNQAKMSRTMSYRYFTIQFIDMRNTREGDPIFMRALATCLIMNLGLHKQDALNRLQTDPLLSRWYQIIQNSKTFSPIIYAELERSHTQMAYKYLEEYITWSGNQDRDVARVPFLSLQILSQNIQILAQAGRDIRAKYHHLKTLSSMEEIKTLQLSNLKTTIKSIADTKISILKASKAKSESLGDIEIRKQKDLDKQLDDRQRLIRHLTTKFNEFATEVESETVNFKNGVRLATALAVAEAAAEAVNGIMSIFSGGFNPAKILKAAKKAKTLAAIIKKLVKVMKTIASLLRKRKLMGTVFKRVRGAWKKMKPKISNFFRRQKKMLSDWFNKKATVLNRIETKELKRYKKFMDGIKIGGKALDNTKSMVENTVSFLKAERTVRMGYDPGNPVKGVTIGKGESKKKLATDKEAVNEFKDRLAQGVAKQGNKLSAVDVFKWTIAKEHVTGMIDTTLSDDVPEATNYRTALLKLITTGETRTQASIDKASLEASFCLSRHSWTLYFIESVSIAKEIARTEADMKQKITDLRTESLLRKFAEKKRSAADMDVEWEILSVKLELVRLNEEYCNAYYYFHLEKCQEDLRINPSDDLEKVLSMQNMLLYQSNQKLRDLYPPPQTFTDRSILIEKPKHCQCLKHFQTFKLTSTTTSDERNRVNNARHDAAKGCLESAVVYPLQKSEETPAELLKRYHSITNNIMKKCTNDTIANVIKYNEFTYKVDIDSPYFSKHERVRIDEVKAIFKGAKTSSGIIEIYAESTGVYEDRYNGKCYKFIGEKWIRTLSYYTKSALTPKRNEISNQDLDTKLDQVIAKLGKLETKLENDKDSKITFIDSGNTHKGFEGVFTAPTAFTTWTFTIPTNRNPGLNLAGLNEIELKFTGSFVTSGVSSSLLQCKMTDDDTSDQTTPTPAVDQTSLPINPLSPTDPSIT